MTPFAARCVLAERGLPSYPLPPFATPMPPPLRFSHYRVLQQDDGSPWLLGIGAMGVTYKAFDERLQLVVALKVIAPGKLHDTTVQALFLREARAAARVRHSNVASVLALDDTPGQLFYAMEFVPGLTLQALLQKRKRLPPALALGIALQTARGLEAIHRQGLIHRDLKPANLMLMRLPDVAAPGGATWEVKVIDFGLARALASAEKDETQVAQTQGFRGTALYASPEQCLERGDLDGRADLYSLGCILCEMLLGRPPFSAASLHEVMAMHISNPVPIEVLDLVTEPLRPVLEKLLAKLPSDRPISAAALARTLEQILPGLEPVSAAAAEMPDLDEPAPLRGPGVGAIHHPPRFGAVGEDHASTLVEGVEPPPARLRARSTQSQTKSIAVLALANLSSDREHEYFSDGISDELLNALSKIPGFRVAARTSAFYFKGRTLPLAEIAQQLAVDYLVDGSVRRAGDRVRISVQLVAASDGFPIWSDTFERELRDVFAVQDEIAGIVAKNLQLKLDTTAGEARSVDPEAFRFYLEGRQAIEPRSPEAVERGERLFRRALEIEPAFPRAMGALANAMVLRADFGFLQNGSWETQNALRWQAEQLADAAIALDPAEAEAIVSRGVAAWSRGNMPEAIRQVRAALALNPSNAPAHHILARALGANGELDEAIQHIRQALTLDPLSPRIADNYALALNFAGRSAEALALADLGLVRLPADQQLPAWRAWALSDLGREAEAVEAARELVGRGGTWVFYIACGILQRAGFQAEAEEAAAYAQAGPVMSHVFCQAALGRPETVVNLVPRNLGAMFFEELLYPAMWDSVRDSAAFRQLLADLNLTEANARAQAWRARKELALAQETRARGLS